MGKRYVVLDRNAMNTPAERATVQRSTVSAALVLIPGKHAGGPDRLVGAVLDTLIECERCGAATVLLAADVGDLDTTVAAVCRQVATDQPEVAEEATLRFGADRVHVLDSIDTAQAKVWAAGLLETIGTPADGRSRRGSAAARIAPLRAVYGKIRGRSQ